MTRRAEIIRIRVLVVWFQRVCDSARAGTCGMIVSTVNVQPSFGKNLRCFSFAANMCCLATWRRHGQSVHPAKYLVAYNKDVQHLINGEPMPPLPPKYL